jgi:transcriptional regulator GlxA family with amidase domain
MSYSCKTIHVSLIAIPEAVISTLSGIYDTLNFVPRVMTGMHVAPSAPVFHIDIVGKTQGDVTLASGLSLQAHRGIKEITQTDIVIVPAVLVDSSEWQRGRYPELVMWLQNMHGKGALLCSACSGIFLLAETGLFDSVETTVHWNYARAFQKSFPAVPTNPERVLVVAGRHEELVTSGASASWHDLVLYLITRYVAPTAAQAAAKFFALQWHKDGLAPYVVFEAPTDHDDSIIANAQAWLATHFSVGNPVAEMIKRSGVAERSFKRHFTNATGYSPIAYVQRLRIEEAKRHLERTDMAVEEVSWQVGYEDPAFFRRLFKRITGITPASYRRKFQVPDYKTDGVA